MTLCVDGDWQEKVVRYSAPKLEWIFGSRPVSVEPRITEEAGSVDDIPELSGDQLTYIRSQQEKADNLVSDPSSAYFEPDEGKRRVAARSLMREWERERS